MGEAKRYELCDVRYMSLIERTAYVTHALERARVIAAQVPDGAKLYAAFEPMLRFVVLSERPHYGGCHDTSAVLYMRLRQVGMLAADVTLCIGEVTFEGSRFDHSWLQVRDQVFDVAVCAPNLVGGGFAGGPLFAGVDLNTNFPAQAKFGVASNDRLDAAAKLVHTMSLSKYQAFQESMGYMTMAELAHGVYGVDGLKLVADYAGVLREWRNPLLNPQRSGA